MKKTIAVFLCFIMIINLLPMSSLAEDPLPGGEAQYKITLEYDREKGLIQLDGSHENPGEYFFEEGLTVAVDIQAEYGYRISDVIVDGASVGEVSSYEFDDLSADHTIEVLFMPVTYIITATAGVGGSIYPSGDITVEHGINQAFTVTPDAMYIIQDVIIDGELHEGPINTFEFINIESNHSIEAVFELAPPEERHVTLSYDTNKGSISINNDYEDGERLITVVDGDTINVEIEADAGYKISAITVDEAAHDDFNERLYSFQLEVTEDITVSVEFAPITYTLTASAGENGTISPEGVITGVVHGSDQQYVITPDNGYKIDQVIVNNIADEDHNSFDFIYELQNIDDNYTIEVTFELIGDGSTREITVETVGNGTICTADLVDGVVSVLDGFDKEFTITPEPGYRISGILILPETMSQIDITGRDIIYNGDGSFTFTLKEVFDDMTLRITFDEQELSELTDRSYAVLQENFAEPLDSEGIKAALAYEMSFIGYAVPTADIAVSDINTDTDTLGYGTFNFTVAIGDDTSPEATGYIVPVFDKIIFKTTSDGVEEIRIADSEDYMDGVFGLPAMDRGYIEIFGIHGARMEGFLSPDVEDAIAFVNSYKVQVLRPFYRADFHIGNMVGEEGPGESNPEQLNWFGFTTIQDDAFCVKVDATSEEVIQRTLQWDLNRYAVLNSGRYLSEVFFGNDTFEISIPEAGIGGVSTISVAVGDFQGYTVTETVPDERYEIFFKSDFYDRIAIDVTMNGNEVRRLTIHRVGVQIQKEVFIEDRGEVVSLSHGTQFSTNIDFSDGNHYRVYATYCIPDQGEDAPYGLYVIYTYANGTRASKIITDPCDDPSPNRNAEEYIDGVFIYANDAACCDYLLYSAADETNAPVKINVTVLKGNPLAAESFEGIFFGSGAGVEWVNE